MFVWGDFVIQVMFLSSLVLIVALVVTVIRKSSKRSKQLDRIENKIDGIQTKKDS